MQIGIQPVEISNSRSRLYTLYKYREINKTYINKQKRINKVYIFF